MRKGKQAALLFVDYFPLPRPRNFANKFFPKRTTRRLSLLPPFVLACLFVDRHRRRRRRRSWLGCDQRLEQQNEEEEEEEEEEEVLSSFHTSPFPVYACMSTTTIQRLGTKNRTEMSRRPTIPSFTTDRMNKLTKYCLGNLTLLPSQLISLDTNRLSIVFFSISALDLMNRLEEDEEEEVDVVVSSTASIEKKEKKTKDGVISKMYLTKTKQKEIVNWIYGLQVLPRRRIKGEDADDDADDDVDGIERSGFQGGTFLGLPYDSKEGTKTGSTYASLNHGHVAMTYFALATLTILGDDFGRVDRRAILEGLKRLQRKDGSFSATAFGTESGMRFLYCACAVSYMLNDWSGVDVPLALKYVRSCRTYDGGAMGLTPGLEAHGGSTYCGIAALDLMGHLREELGPSGRKELIG